MNMTANLHIALATTAFLAFGTGCASIIREPPKPSPVQDNIVLPKALAEPTAANMPLEPQVPKGAATQAADSSSAPTPAPTPAPSPSSTPKPAVPAAKSALKQTPQPEHAGYMSKTPVALPPSTKSDGSLTRLDEMKKQGAMSEDEYGQIKRQILENPE